MSTLDYAERLRWAQEHAIRLAAKLETPSAELKRMPQRLYRARYFDAAGDYVVVTIVHYLLAPAQAPTLKLQVFVTRPYFNTTSGSGANAHLTLMGEYSVDEVVAFLALDELDPASVEWCDETKYSPIAVVGDIIGKHLRD